MSLIPADNTLLLWTFLMVSAAAAIYMEQNCRWTSKIPGAVIALLIALAASNFGIIPTESPVYDVVWGYVVPLAIPLLLFQLNFQALFKESSRLLVLFLLSSIGTMIGALIGYYALHNYIPELDKISGMIAASYTGGGVNFAAMTARLEPSKGMTAATIVADNLMMACYFFILISISASTVIRRIWGSPHQDKLDRDGINGHNTTANYWKPKPISLQNIALSLAASILIVAISFTLSAWLKGLLGEGSNVATNMLLSLVTDKYLLLTSITLITIAIFGKNIQKLEGSQELGMYAIYLFFVVIGIPASIPLIIQNAPLLFVFTLTVAIVNLIITMIFGKLFKFGIEEIVLACNANIGGPTTAAALAISKGWRDLIGPILLIGTVGYVIGNYVGMLVYGLLQ